MEVQSYYIVTNAIGQFMELTYHPEAGESFSSWGGLANAAYFEKREEAVIEALKQEKYTYEQTYICQVNIDVGQQEKTTDVAQILRQEHESRIMNNIMKKTPIKRDELEEVITIIMEGSGKIIGSKVIKGEPLNILFEEISPNEWVVKQKNIPL